MQASSIFGWLIKGLIFSTILLLGQARATHIVGGEITYRHLGNNEFRINLSIYMDCFNGAPDAIQSDREANVAIFNAAGQLVRNIPIIWTGPQRITNVSYSCVVPPANACVDFYSYATTINLQPIAGGYTIAYQRCCRNGTITNLNDPGSQGATFVTQIPDVSTNGYNSSPVYKSLPPNFLCTGELFEFDHSATDSDADSLVYELFRPNLGANRDNPRPVPAQRPPYQNIIYANGYNATNPMDGAPTMSINPKTGRLTALPTRAGQFVVGIAVLEYRKGKLIGRTNRDFQFNVSACVFNVKADFIQKEKYCSSLIDFGNTSKAGVTYRWDFGVESKDDDTSLLREPSYLFPGPGMYQVTLLASDGNCVNSIKKWVEVPDDTTNFLPDSAKFCSYDSIQIGKPDPAGVYTFSWSPTVGLSNSRIAQPYARPENTTSYIVRRNYKTCFILDTIEVRPIKLNADFSNYYNPPCIGQEVAFTFNGDADYYKWDFGVPGSKTDTTSVPNRKFVYRDTGVYIAQVQAFREGCTQTKAEIIHIMDPDIFAVRTNHAICEGDTVKLVPGGWGLKTPLAFTWNPVTDLNFADQFSPVVFPKNDVTYVLTKNYGDCARYDTFNVKIMRLPGVKAGRTIIDSICSKAEAPLFVRGGNFYNWWPGAFLDDSTSANPIARPEKSTTFYVRVDSTNGCYTIDSVHVPVLPVYSLNLPEDTVLCEGEPLIFNNYVTRSTFNWRPIGTDGFGVPQKEGKYVLTIQSQCQTLMDTVNLFYFVEDHCIMQIPNAFTPNSDGKNDRFPFGVAANEIYIKPCSFPTYRFVVFSRWGQKIFESYDPEHQWDGTIGGVAAPVDVYVWLIEYQVFNQCQGFFINKNANGNVTLLR